MKTKKIGWVRKTQTASFKCIDPKSRLSKKWIWVVEQRHNHQRGQIVSHWQWIKCIDVENEFNSDWQKAIEFTINFIQKKVDKGTHKWVN